MANRRASISAGLRADATGWTRGLHQARIDAQKLKMDVERMKINGPKLDTSGFDKFKNSATNVNAKVGLIREGLDALAAPSAANAWFADLQDRLKAVTGNSEQAAEMMRQLRPVSDEQSLSDEQLETLVNYSERMISLGYSVEQTADMMRELANAAEWQGRGVESFAPMIEALDKVGQSGEVSMKSIMALSKETPSLRNALRAAFGAETAADMEKLKLTNEELVAGILAGLKTIETSTPSLNEDGLGIIGRSKQWSGADKDTNEGSLPERKEASADELRERTKAAGIQRQAAEAAAAELKNRLDVNDAIREMRSSMLEASDVDRTMAEGDRGTIAIMEDQKELQEQIEKIRAAGLKVDEDQVDAVRRLVAARREDKDRVQRIQNQKEVAKSEQENQVAGLRHMGRNRRADKIEDDAAVKDLVAGGMDEKSARHIVDSRRDQAQDEALGPGRRRIRGAKKGPPKIEVPNEGAVEGVQVPGEKKPPQQQANAAPPDSPKLAEIAASLKAIEKNTQRPAADRQKPSNR